METGHTDELLTYDELAALLKLSAGTLRNWVSQEYIPHVKIGRAVRFEPNIIQAWLKRRAHPGRLRYRNELQGHH